MSILSLKSFKKRYGDYKKIRNLIGFGGFLKRIIHSYYEEVMLCRDLNEVKGAFEESDIKIFSIERKHIAQLGALRKQAGLGGSNPSEHPEEYINNGCKGFGAESNGEVVGYIWCPNRKGI